MSKASHSQPTPRNRRATGPAPSARWQTVQWMGLRMRVPADWQVVRHGLSPTKGSLYFMDRREQRLQLTWTRCRIKPELHRLLSDYRAAQLQREPEARFHEFSAPGWEGTLRKLERGRALIRAATYDTDADVLIEAVLLTNVSDADAPGAADADAARELLAAIELVTAPESNRRWRAFGLDVTTPTQWRLSRAQVQPGDVTLTFEQFDSRKGRPRGNECRVRRMGMADHWFQGPEAWLHQQLKKVRFETEPARWGPHDGCEARSVLHSSPWARLARRTRQRTDRLWHCETQDAVYHLTMLTRPCDTTKLNAFEVPCCANGAATDEPDGG